MEPVAHSLTGAALARLLPMRGVSRRTALVTGIVAANLPDVDVLLYATHGEHGYLTCHRGVTHSVFALALMPPVWAALVARVSRTPFKPLLALSFAAVLSHLLLDLVTSFGMMPLAPLSWERVALPWVFIVEPAFWLILGVPFALARRPGARPRRIFAVAFALLAAWIGASGVFASLAEARARELAAAEGIAPLSVHAWPTPLWPTVRSTVVTDRDLAHHAVIDLVGGDDHFREHIPRNLEDPLVAFVRSTRPGRDFMAWAGDPVARVAQASEDGKLWSVMLWDLRYWSPIGDAPIFAMAFEVSDEGRGRYTLRSWRWRNRGRGEPIPGIDAPPRAVSVPAEAAPSGSPAP
ncbi:MAG: metal-dependent hydrolase [Deltaproteobacteria bacterium]|nr:metal-dependent hydrolase [Deltaproteobacteria bacterium]